MPDRDEAQSPDNQVRFRADPEVVQALRARMSPRANGLGGIAKRDLERYYAQLAAALPVFGADEAGFILDALSRERVDHHFSHLVWAVVADASEQRGLAARWGVDAAALIGRLRDLTPFEKLALVDASERAHFLYRAKLGPIDDEQHDRAAFLHAAWAVGLAEAC